MLSIKSTPSVQLFVKRRKRAIFLIALFTVIFVSVRIVIKPINNTDYTIYAGGLRDFWHNGVTPYNTVGFILPPWCTFILAPIMDQPLQTWLALSVALYVVIVFDLGTPAALLQIIHPIFITLIASSNPEWILVGPGLYLLERAPRGWGRGLAWVFLASKPQSTFGLLIFDGLAALRQRDWKAFGIAAAIAIGTFILVPQPLASLLKPHEWSASVIAHYWLIGAIGATILIVAIRWQRRGDYKTLGLLLTPVWTPYTLQYNLMAIVFTMRKAGWVRNALFLVGGLILTFLFWRDYHVAEQVGAFGMVVLAALLAPSYAKNNILSPPVRDPQPIPARDAATNAG